MRAGTRHLRRVVLAVTALSAVSLATPGSGFAAGWLAPFSVSATVTGGLNARVAMNARGDMIVAWQYGNGADTTVQAAVRPVHGSFLAPVTVAAAGETAAAPQVGIDSAGNAAVVWRRDVAGKGTVRAVLRPAGGEFGDPIDVSAAGEDASAPRVAFGANGDGIVVWVRLDGAHKVVRALTRAGAGVVSGPVDVSSASEDASEPRVAIDSDGNAIVVWTGVGAKRSERPAGDAFSAPIRIAPDGELAVSPEVAVGDDGAAIVTWRRIVATNTVVLRAAVRAPGASAFGAPENLSASGAASGPTAVAMNAHGDAAVAWEQIPESFNIRVQATTRPTGGAFADAVTLDDDGAAPAVAITPSGDAFFAWRAYKLDDDVIVRVKGAKLAAGAAAVTASQFISSATAESDEPQLAADGAGDAVAVWRPVGDYTGLPPDGENTSSGTIGAGVFDATAPIVDSVTVPQTATAEVPVEMSASASDLWSTAAIRFDFGDGATQAGGTVSHTYTIAGTYTVTVTATDGAGNTAISTRTITVAVAPANQPPPTTDTNPSPPPGGTPQPGPVGPTAAQIKTQLLAQITPAGVAARLGKLAKARRYALRYTALTAGTATITWTAKPAGKSLVIATGTRRFTSAGATTITIKLTAKGVKLLKHVKSLKVSATSMFTARGVAPITASKTFTLKR